jgi:hypothetical protein
MYEILIFSEYGPQSIDTVLAIRKDGKFLRDIGGDDKMIGDPHDVQNTIERITGEHAPIKIRQKGKWKLLWE